MIYAPNPKSLVYSELCFIATRQSGRTASISMDAIFDEVSREIFTLFVDAAPVAETTPAWDYASAECLLGHEQ